MEAAVSMAGLAYIVNVILDEKKQIQAVFVGD
jgi:nickel-dependent lactate racemase